MLVSWNEVEFDNLSFQLFLRNISKLGPFISPFPLNVQQ